VIVLRDNRTLARSVLRKFLALIRTRTQ